MTRSSTSQLLAEHPLQGDQLSFNLREQAAQLRGLLGDAERRGIALIKEQGLNIVLTVLREGARIGGRETPGACAAYVIHGRLRVESPGPPVELNPGEMAAFNARIGQQLLALEESAVLMIVALDSDHQSTG